MKIIGTFGGVVIASIVLLQPVEAGSRGGGGRFSSGHSSMGGARHFSGPSRSFSGGGARYSGGGPRFSGGGARYSGGGARYSGTGPRIHNSSARFSSGTTFRHRSGSNSGPRFANHNNSRFNTPRVNPDGANRNWNRSGDGSRWDGNRNRTRSGDGSRWDGNRNWNRTGDGSRGNGNRNWNRTGGGSRGNGDRNWNRSGDSSRFNGNSDGIVGRRGGNWNRHWDKGRDHHWNGHRCRWINNSWVIFAAGFYPWYGYPYGYGGYYPYGDYYYDDGYYADESSQPAAYSEGAVEGAVDANVSEIQSALSREGYYSGAIDGDLGPATRSALRRYQRDRGLSATGRLDRATINALGLR